MKTLKIIGEGALFMGSNGQGNDMKALRKDPLAKAHAPTHKSGFDTAHLARYDGTDFVQWQGRRSDGYFYSWGPIFQIVDDD